MDSDSQKLDFIVQLKGLIIFKKETSGFGISPSAPNKSFQFQFQGFWQIEHSERCPKLLQS